jgi:hypothetical protein
MMVGAVIVKRTKKLVFMVHYSVIQRRSLPYNYRLYEPRYNNSQKNSPAVIR